MPAQTEIALATVEDMIERAIVRLSRSGDRERALLSGASTAWPKELLDSAEAIRKAVQHGCKVSLRGDDWDDVHRCKDEVRPARKQAAPISDDDMLLALSWVAALGRKRNKPARTRRRRGAGHLPQDFEARIVWWVALGFSFDQIGMRVNTDARTAERRYREAIIDCWRIANGRLQVGARPNEKTGCWR